MSLSSRLDDLESDPPPGQSLRAAGLDEQRIEDVLDERGKIVWERLEDDELRAVIDAGPDRIHGHKWENLSDEQLQRIAGGEDPETVLR